MADLQSEIKKIVDLPEHVETIRQKLGEFECKKELQPSHYVTYRKFDDEDQFAGHANSRQEFDGYGIYYCKKTGEVYEGQWENHKRNGNGRVIYANLAVYEG